MCVFVHVYIPKINFKNGGLPYFYVLIGIESCKAQHLGDYHMLLLNKHKYNIK